MEINKIQDLVVAILENDCKSRNSDDYLYYMVCSIIKPEVKDMNYTYFLLHRGEMKLPAYESVSRARRKVQRYRTDLCGIPEVEAGREVKRLSFKNYALKLHL